MLCNTAKDCGSAACPRRGSATLCIDHACACLLPRKRSASSVLLLSVAVVAVIYMMGGRSTTTRFQAADTFRGYKKGYVFKRGDNGLGYYLDM